MESRKVITTMLGVAALALGFFMGLGLGVANAEEPTRCATIIPTDQNTPYVFYEKISVDDGLFITGVGHYFWMQNIAGEPTADHSVVSVDLNSLPAEEVTLCVGDTSYTEAEAEVMRKVVDGPPEWVFATPDPEPRAIRVWIPQ